MSSEKIDKLRRDIDTLKARLSTANHVLNAAVDDMRDLLSDIKLILHRAETETAKQE